MRKEFKAKIGQTYQTREKLCLVVVVNRAKQEYLPVPCNDLRGDATTICHFDRKIKLRLSGICKNAPTDSDYVILKPQKRDDEGSTYIDHYRTGTFVGK